MGASLLVLFVVWAVVSGAISGRSPGPLVAVAAASAAALVLGRAAARRDRRLVAGLVIVFAGALYVFEAARNGPWADPLGYENASALLAVLGAVAGMTLASQPGSVPVRLFGVAAAVVFGSVPFAMGAVASSLLVVAALGAVAFCRVTRRVRWGVVGAAGLFVVILSGTVVLGATYEPEDGDAPSEIAGSLLSERRLALWHDALLIAAEHPIVGVGPGGFPFASPVAASDPDTRQAHNEFLQQAAEIGIPGAVVLVLLVLWGFRRLLVVPSGDMVALLGAVSLAAVAIGASVDYVLHFPVVPIVGAALIGAAQADAAGRGVRPHTSARGSNRRAHRPSQEEP